MDRSGHGNQNGRVPVDFVGPATSTFGTLDGNHGNQRGPIRATGDLRSSGNGDFGNLVNRQWQPRKCSNNADKVLLVDLVDLVDMNIRTNKKGIVTGVFRDKKQLNRKLCPPCQLWQPVAGAGPIP